MQKHIEELKNVRNRESYSKIMNNFRAAIYLASISDESKISTVVRSVSDFG